MSLFDTIRYPISLPITGEKLETLPKELYKKWAEYVVGEEAKNNRSDRAYFNVYAFSAYFDKIPPNYQEAYIEELRKRIYSIGKEE